MLSVSDILFTFLGYGFGVGCTIRVGQLLGSQRPAQAKLAGACLIVVKASHWHYKAGQ
jgi:Na+-driven multidrug efflux pump